MILGWLSIICRSTRVSTPAASSAPLIWAITLSIVRGVAPMSDRSIPTDCVPALVRMVTANFTSPWNALTLSLSAPSWIGVVVKVVWAFSSAKPVLTVDLDTPCTIRTSSKPADFR